MLRVAAGVRPHCEGLNGTFAGVTCCVIPVLLFRALLLPVYSFGLVRHGIREQILSEGIPPSKGVFAARVTLAQLCTMLHRIAVLGGGVAGCMCAATLSRTGTCVTLVEMGRGLGGRASTRRTREDPNLLIDHGAPKFHVKTTAGMPA